MCIMVSLIYLYVLININLFASAANYHKDNEMNQQQWNSYKNQFNKAYASEEENQRRMKFYLYNSAKIIEHNERFENGEVSYKLGINQFSDLTPQEFAKLRIHTSRTDVPTQYNNTRVITSSSIAELVPQTKNWVAEGAVSSVKNQGKCRCYWAFAAAGVVEGHMFIHNKGRIPVRNLSAQNLLDCVGILHGYDANSCDGGYEEYALNYMTMYGIATDESYPYKANLSEYEGICKRQPMNIDTKIKTYRKIVNGDAKLLKNVVGMIGPVTAAIDASDFKFLHYKEGIYYSENCSTWNQNHVLLIVGYGIDKHGNDYWLVKNSWDVTWGERGFGRVARNYNVCGIESYNVWPEF